MTCLREEGFCLLWSALGRGFQARNHGWKPKLWSRLAVHTAKDCSALHKTASLQTEKRNASSGKVGSVCKHRDKEMLLTNKIQKSGFLWLRLSWMVTFGCWWDYRDSFVCALLLEMWISAAASLERNETTFIKFEAHILPSPHPAFVSICPEIKYKHVRDSAYKFLLQDWFWVDKIANNIEVS